MADLTGHTPASTYKQLINIGSGNIGLTGSIQYVTDGEGNISKLGLSLTSVYINATSITINGCTLTVSGNSTINGSFTGTSSGTNTGDQTITLTGDVTGSGTGSFATSYNNNVPLTKGGLNASLTANNGGIFYSTSTGGAILAGTTTAGQILRSGSSSAPSWSTATYPSTSGTANKFLQSDGTNFVSSSSTWPTTGTQGGIVYCDSSNSFSQLAKSSSGIQYLSNQGTSSAPLYRTILGTDINNPFLSVVEGRLTLTSATPVLTSDVTAATTIYFTNYKGNKVPLYNGTSWDLLSFTELSIAVPATTSTMYDVFIYNNSGTAALELLAWTNDTTRATALAFQDGVYVKSGAATRRYLGSFRTTGVSGQTEDSLIKRYLWNYYHRVYKPMIAVDTTDTWTYSSTGYRQMNNNAANQLDFVIGVSEDSVDAQTIMRVLNSTSTGRTVSAAIGLDSTGSSSSAIKMSVTVTSTGFQQVSASYNGYPGAGRHILVPLEAGGGADSQTWYGDNGTVTLQTGIWGDWIG